MATGSKPGMALVGIVMGSDTDFPVMNEAGKTLGKFGIAYEMEVLSAHRTPARAHEYATTAAEARPEGGDCRGGSGGASGGSDGGEHHAAGDRRAHGHEHAGRARRAARNRADARRNSGGDDGD